MLRGNRDDCLYFFLHFTITPFIVFCDGYWPDDCRLAIGRMGIRPDVANLE